MTTATINFEAYLTEAIGNYLTDNGLGLTDFSESYIRNIMSNYTFALAVEEEVEEVTEVAPINHLERIMKGEPTMLGVEDFVEKVERWWEPTNRVAKRERVSNGKRTRMSYDTRVMDTSTGMVHLVEDMIDYDITERDAATKHYATTPIGYWRRKYFNTNDNLVMA